MSAKNIPTRIVKRTIRHGPLVLGDNSLAQAIEDMVFSFFGYDMPDFGSIFNLFL